MIDNRRQVLEMLAGGKITPEQAEGLLAALETPVGTQAVQGEPQKKSPRYLRVLVLGEEGKEHVNIRVPFMLLRAGVRLAHLVPGDTYSYVASALEKEGVHVSEDAFKPEKLEELIDHLADTTVNVDEDGARVRVFCE